MSIQQAESWNLWEKSMVMRRQALRRTVASVPRKSHFASILIVLLTGTWLLGTPTFGESGCSCNSKKFRACLAEATKVFEDMNDRCEGKPTRSSKYWGRGQRLHGQKKHLPEPARDFMGGVILEGLTVSEALLLEYAAKGRASVLWGGIGLVVVYGLETYKLHAEYSDWSSDLDSCLDTALKFSDFQFKDCARESGCWPGSCAVAEWRGEGTIKIESNADRVFPRIPTMRTVRDGIFTITFNLIEGSEVEPPLKSHRITGRGTASVTSATDVTFQNKIVTRCTARSQDTTPVSVSGVKEGNMLKLKLLPEPLSAPASISCRGPKVNTSVLDTTPKDIDFMPENAWLEVAAEDEAAGGLDVDSSMGLPAGFKERTVLTIRIRVLQREEGGSRPVSGAPGHSTSELPDPLLADY